MEDLGIEIRILEFGSKDYEESVNLRDKMLRKPLGLVFKQEDLDMEYNDVHIGAYVKDSLIGCLVLSPSNERRIKMRQVAVDDSIQKRGIGTQMVNFSEQYARERNYQIMYCNARDLAIPFYERLGYHTTGEPFIEVSIEHYVMEKEL